MCDEIFALDSDGDPGTTVSCFASRANCKVIVKAWHANSTVTASKLATSQESEESPPVLCYIAWRRSAANWYSPTCNERCTMFRTWYPRLPCMRSYMEHDWFFFMEHDCVFLIHKRVCGLRA
jgi:hypothetical protein